MKKYVYLFCEGNAKMRNLLGGKGANLAEMVKLKLPVPAGFTVTTEACTNFHDCKNVLSQDIEKQIFSALKKVEKTQRQKFGDEKNPLLLSVRSGARVSMPGMMDTILNLGLNDKTVIALANKSNNERFAYDSYRKFIQMYSNVVMNLDGDVFEEMIDKKKNQVGVKKDYELSADDLKDLIKSFKQYYLKVVKEEFPSDVKVQLINAVKAVFRSWDNQRAITYRKLNDIPSSWGTAVNVQSMVFGNMGETSGTGVAFSRNPSTGEDELYGEYLMNAQGEDIVAGIRTPSDIKDLKKKNEQVYNEFYSYAKKLERHFGDMQDMEFTIENGKLYMLQTRNGKRTAKASLKIAIDLVNEKLLTEQEALLLIDANRLDGVLHSSFDEKEIKKIKPVCVGLPASPGCGTGKIALSTEKVLELKKNKINCILVRNETSPEDIEGMNNSKGVVTVRGGMTSHAAVVARGMGIPCVAGCSDIVIDLAKETLKIGEKTYKEGDLISIDATTGNVYDGEIRLTDAEMSSELATIMSWANKYKGIGVRANADTPTDASVALKFGAEGIGLCRTEHMFFAKDRILHIREMIVAKTKEERVTALNKLLVYQKKDFTEIFTVLNGKPITIRLIDPPLHEFLPKTKEEIAELAKSTNLTKKSIESTIEELKEFNPMLGHRGCRLTVTYPEITEMQVTAILESAINVEQKKNIKCDVEIMIPLVCDLKEMRFVKEIIEETANKLFEKYNHKVEYKVGTMIEVPRATVIADEIAKEAEFFSFGTNDLTQMTYGFSRDDAGKFLEDYYQKGVFANDPFKTIDADGVGKLIQTASSLGRKTRPNIKMGICGEHGGNPKSVEFFNGIGLDYVSCSPYRVSIAILASAQANIKGKSKNK